MVKCCLPVRGHTAADVTIILAIMGIPNCLIHRHWSATNLDNGNGQAMEKISALVSIIFTRS